MLTPQFYKRRINRVAEYFASLGYDCEVTFGDARAYFLGQPGIVAGSPEKKEDVRIPFHDAMHAIANRLYADAYGEENVAIYEIILMSGPFSIKNEENESLFGSKPHRPGYEAISDFSETRGKTTNVAAMLKGRKHVLPYVLLSDELFKGVIAQAKDDDAFFTKISGGRYFFELSTKELAALPLVCMGIVKDDGEGFSTASIPPEHRAGLLEYLDKHLEQDKEAAQADCVALGLTMPGRKSDMRLDV